jgi:capsular polysaccharide export protein
MLSQRVSMEAAQIGPFLRVPPFPRAKIHAFRASASDKSPEEKLLGLVRSQKVGGTYWASQPELPEQYVLVRAAELVPPAIELGCDPIVLWTDQPGTEHGDLLAISGECDPWHMLAGASAFVSGSDHELCLIAAICGVPVYRCDIAASVLRPVELDAGSLLQGALAVRYENPFTGEPMAVREAIELCGFWRRIIDTNRGIAAGLGFAFWKQDQVASLLWGGTGSFPFLRSARDAKSSGAVAVWRAKTAADQLEAVTEAGIPLIEVEDGFLRSQGLGADCVPPLSITVDPLGAHFDPAQPSELELLLQKGEFDDGMLARAHRLRQVIVGAGLGKYDRAGERLERPAGTRRRILVPGQVEDDRAVQSGGCGLTSNLELLARVRAQEPDAYILYKPHPDVVAGHRRGAVSQELCLRHADEIVTAGAFASLIDVVDEVHVNTSLAGFEALLRGKAVTTYGVPFYAGWGLTRDLGPVPARRNTRRSLDELVAATLLIYPRYLDPVTGLPCPAEIVVDRLSSEARTHPSMLVFMRRLQGRLMRSFRSIVQ